MDILFKYYISDNTNIDVYLNMIYYFQKIDKTRGELNKNKNIAPKKPVYVWHPLWLQPIPGYISRQRC